MTNRPLPLLPLLALGLTGPACKQPPEVDKAAEKRRPDVSTAEVDPDPRIPPEEVGPGPEVDPPEAIAPVANPARGIDSTDLVVDTAAHTGKATIAFEAGEAGAVLEVDGLTVAGVKLGDQALAFEVKDGELHLALPASTSPSTVEISYGYTPNADEVEGVFADRITMTWPYLCGQVFPCHSHPADGSTFTLALENVPEGKTAVYPTRLVESPSYQLAWAIDDFEEKELGKTDAGTSIVTFSPPEHADAMASGTKDLVAMFDFFEKTYGAYYFGSKAGSVAADWEGKSYGGMEHHPYWHMSIAALSIPEIHAHEAAHGWYGDAIRIRCWEDLVLSEGTVSYLAARAVEEIEGEEAAKALWRDYGKRLDGLATGRSMKVAWPEGCNEIDVLKDRLFGPAPYMKGAHFLRALEGKVGKEKLDLALRSFYEDKRGTEASVGDLLDTIKEKTGYDPQACAIAWLREEDPPKDQFDACK